MFHTHTYERLKYIVPMLSVETMYFSIFIQNITIIHNRSLIGNIIDIIIHRPRPDTHPTLDYHCSYMFMAPDNDTYEVS